MSLNVSVKLFCGAELDFHTSDEMDEDFEKSYSREGVYAREIARCMEENIGEDFDEESLAEMYGLRVLEANDELYLAIDDSVTEISGNGMHEITALSYSRRYEELLKFALTKCENSFIQPKWLMSTYYG